MDQLLDERVFQTADGSTHRVRVTRTHPRNGRFVPGVRFLSFESMDGRGIGVAGVSRATIELGPEKLERLLQMAGRCESLPRSAGQ